MSVGRVSRDGRARGCGRCSASTSQLATAPEPRLGLLARLRDLLPGRYVFGLTGRGPGGAVLPPGGVPPDGSSRAPPDGGPPSRKQVDFQIK